MNYKNNLSVEDILKKETSDDDAKTTKDLRDLRDLRDLSIEDMFDEYYIPYFR